jgi:hypothetical protein
MRDVYRAAYIEVVDDLNDYDVSDYAPWIRNLADETAKSPNWQGKKNRDVPSQPEFWTIHIHGAHEGPEASDNDPNVEDALFGYSPGTSIIYIETIRDRSFEEPMVNAGVVELPKALDVPDFVQQNVLHESLHLWLPLAHNAPYGDEGALRENGHELAYDQVTATWKPWDRAADDLTAGQLATIRGSIQPV